jgi:hypothetical protein
MKKNRLSAATTASVTIETYSETNNYLYTAVGSVS